MRRISRIALVALSSMFVASGVVAVGCSAPPDTTSTSSSVSSSSNSSGDGGFGGTGGGMGGKGGDGGKGGSAGSGGMGGIGGMAGAGGAGGMACTPEVCDGIDNDCDGMIDNGINCLCMAGDMESCYDGDPATLNVAECKGGTHTCNLLGEWGPCLGQVLPEMETCDSRDNDCNGNIDDGLGTTTCGVGACEQTVDNCSMGMLVTCEPLPPNAVETCDGTDDNCNGEVDEGCMCIDGMTQSCYTGPMGTQDVGACLAGTQLCVGGVWQPCVGDITPTVETCDNVDNDCDAAVDENLGVSMCGVGACQATVNNCEGGKPQTCVPGQPTLEVCDGVDNDCNGPADDGLGTVSCGLGACANTVPACVAGTPNVCNPLPAGVEACDGIDNNCDGVIDDGNPGGGGMCSTGNPGVCDAGVEQCTGGMIVCAQSNQPGPEVCDGMDNDCNGMVDDNAAMVGSACVTNLPGICAAGTFACNAGTLECVANNMATAEVCDGIDNDCDGQVDNGNPGGTLPCNTGNLGICANGSTSCVNGAIVCNQNTAPNTEICDGLDNDCDGSTDEGNPGGGANCTTGQQGVCSAGTTACSGGSVVCNANQNPSAETCDNLDNDCDGQADEGNPGGGLNCNTGQQGVCSAGTTSCNNGSIVCNQNTTSSAEVCDGLDNDCNGTVDNGNPGGGVSCTTGQQGVCSAGTTACTGGTVVCNRDQNPSAETCDGLDNDCNGTVDNGNPGGGANCNTGQLGVCSAGTTSCTNGGIVCNQNTASSAETCDGLDNDCNGVVDNGNPGGGVSCNTGQQGVCSAGTTACTGGSVVCNQNTPSSAEVCDGLDNDCNGVADNGNPGGGLSCSTGQQGVCSAGTTACSGGAIVCNQNTASSAEICDGLDNDCNGTVDNGNPGGGVSCTTGQQGVCSAGTTACTGGSVVCNQNTPSSAEVCDGLDNDCNGAVDNGNPGGGVSCNTGQQGICAAGTTACTAGAVVCNRNNNPSNDICDGLDNDCDGSIDEGNPGGGVACNTGLPGVCAAGVTACSAGAIVCVQMVFPSTETCDGLDNDCNGTVDNGNPGGGVSCTTGQQGVCSAGTTACTSGAIVCNRNTNPSAEVCDGLDNDCNGTVDNGNPGGGVSCTTGQPGICSAGTTACTSGALVCNRNNNPTTDICDGLDNDCDGALDENDPTTTCAAQNPGAGGVATWSCTGMCNVNTCQAGFANIDGALANGCECATDVFANACSTASTTNVAVGATINFTGKVETAAGSDWIRVTFTDRPLGQPFHPKIVLTTNPGGQYAMDVQSACGTPAACSTTGNSTNNESGTNVTTWEHFNNGYVTGAGCCSDNTPHVTSVFVRVYRKNGDAPQCANYVVTATNL